MKNIKKEICRRDFLKFVMMTEPIQNLNVIIDWRN